jgi:hypothetical protein
MAMLTDTQCRTAKPKDKPYKLSDGKGLYLEIKPSMLAPARNPDPRGHLLDCEPARGHLLQRYELEFLRVLRTAAHDTWGGAKLQAEKYLGFRYRFNRNRV